MQKLNVIAVCIVLVKNHLLKNLVFCLQIKSIMFIIHCSDGKFVMHNV
jgi:hypothetical protein